MFDVMLKVQTGYERLKTIILIRDTLAGIQQVYSVSIFACDNNRLNMFHFICTPLFNHCLGVHCFSDLDWTRQFSDPQL